MGAMGVDTIHGYCRHDVYGAGGIGEMVMHAKAVRKMIEYIANGMPTRAYVLIGIAVYEITRRLIG